ncbi:transient receptor potential cation channel subfamily M member-like 2 [Branchiostoma floridae]|uniref:Transient receptor potential cation channel subfamily M member-like 2 n=1 Tax=Branchiostoma floridae TaxID=7739 RepID=A0A9J7MBB6_BRAFL|nr:transient receptor potential cation channel subfamily M member-like 2 [Branchiostoma floridae]
MQHLLLWAVMMNRRKLARLFWRMGKDHVASALTASKVLKSLAKFADSKGKLDLSLDLNNHADEFERLACGVISECYRLDKTSQDLLIRRQENWGNTTCLAIAYSSRHVKFMSLDAWQSKLNKVWMGKMAPYTTWWRVLSSMFLPFMMFLPIFTIKFEVQVKDRKQEDSVQQAGGQDRFSSVSWPWQRKAQGIGPLQAISNFHVAPITKFMYTYVFYMAYMVIFSIFILTDLHPLEENPISILEYLTIARLTSLLFEEIRQICVEHPKSRWHKVKIWFGSFWNKMDCVLHLMFLLSLVLRLTVAAGPGFEYVRGIYCITLGSSFLRMAQLFLVHAKIGPKVIMIQKMLVDLGIFLGIMLLFIFAYGVMRHALLYPNSPLGWPLLRDVFLIPYWQVYGELFIDNADGTILGSPLVTVLQALYMLLTNVLILNLLIAMFSYTFQKIQDNSEQVWRFNRNEYILEFHDRPWGPPPFIILGLAWRFGRWLWLRHKHKEDFNDFNRKFSEEYVGRLQLVERAAATNYFTKNPHLENEEIQDTTNSERPDSATTCITDAVTDLQHRMSKLEDHLGSIKDLLEQRLPKT